MLESTAALSLVVAASLRTKTDLIIKEFLAFWWHFQGADPKYWFPKQQNCAGIMQCSLFI